jgi:hypothetical protein
MDRFVIFAFFFFVILDFGLLDFKENVIERRLQFVEASWMDL